MWLTTNVRRGILLACTVCVLATMAPTALALPADPNNAALLYYQAFLMIAAENLDDEARIHISDVVRGNAAPDEKVCESISKYKTAIGYAEAAMSLRVCDWGIRYSQGFDTVMPQLAQMRFLTYVVLADARVRASNGDYRGALERCLMTDTLAYHIGDDTLISYLVSLSIRQLGCECIKGIMGQTVGDAELLQWLRHSLATFQAGTIFPGKSLKVEIEFSLSTMQMDRRDKLAGALAPEDKKLAQALATADEETLERTRRMYSECAHSALTILSTPMPYPQAHSKISQLGSGLDPNDPASLAARSSMATLPTILAIKTKTEACVNAVKAAAEICLYRAKTGRLPDVLLSGLPKEPFSGKDFQYERTKTGFMLRCQEKDLVKGKVYEFVFPVK